MSKLRNFDWLMAHTLYLSGKPMSELKSKSDKELWVLVETALAELKAVDASMKVLIEKRKSRYLVAEEKLKLELLSDEYNDLILARTNALVELQDRGYDVEAYVEAQEIR